MKSATQQTRLLLQPQPVALEGKRKWWEWIIGEGLEDPKGHSLRPESAKRGWVLGDEAAASPPPHHRRSKEALQAPQQRVPEQSPARPTVFGRPFVKRFALSYRTVVCPVCLTVAKRLDGSRCHLVRREASGQATLY